MVHVSFFSKKDKRILEEERPFVDREEYLQSFKDALESIRDKKLSILIYYGVAGIGKTSLRKEFPKIIEESNESHKNSHILWVTINFETEEFRQPQKFLEIMRDQFRDNYGIKFHTFDIAHALYWSKVNPRIPLSRENYSDDSIVTNLLDIGENLSSAHIGFNPAKLISDIKKLIKKFPDQYNEWALKNMDEISRLIYMEPSDIEKKLYLYWAYDLQEYLCKTSEAAVIFIDSYEALWGKDRSLSKVSSENQWFRKLIQKLLSSSCLWVICGQELPRWEEYSSTEKALWGNSIERHKVEGLPEEDTRYLLECCDVLEKDIQDIIIRGSGGVPYYLDLSIDTYKNIKKNKKPEPSDFAKVPAEVLERFIKYLDENKEAAIKVLSVPNFWNREIFNALIKEFTNYPQNGFSIINSFSFIDKDEIEDEKWSMHQLMRQSWQEYQRKNEPTERKIVHKFMLNYYENKLEKLEIKKITKEHKTALREAFYHAKELLEAEDLLKWFSNISYSFYEAALWQLITPMSEEMLQILEVELGSEHPSFGMALNNLAELYRNKGDYERALQLYQRNLEISENVLGSQHPIVAITLNNLALLYVNMGDYEKVLPLYQRTLEINENVLGPQHPHIATTLNNIAGLYLEMGDYEKAFPFYQKALDIREKILGPQHPSVAITLNGLAELYRHREDFEKAYSFYQRALNIRENVFGLKHPSVATALNNLALLYANMGDYDEALPLYQRALDIRENVLGPQHPDVAITLNNLGSLYVNVGNYEKALQFFLRAYEIFENALSPQHPSLAITLNNLARLYERMGAYEKALPLLQRVLEINENVLGPQHPEVANILNDLASIYKKTGDYEKALSLYQRALDIRENVLGLQHPGVANSLNNLAELYKNMDDYDEALPLYLRALEIIEKILGPQHPYFATILNNLAGLYYRMGDYEKALPLYQKALDICENVQCSQYIDIVLILNNLAELYCHLGDYKKTLSLVKRIKQISSNQLQ